jgi:molybdopterin-biosynthesis enzyme MoeA-like protein
VFTTGGIGPTHDDITADSIARAFGVSIDVDERAVAMLLERIAKADLNEARLRMARIPAGASLIANPVSKAPGFTIGNVHVMAGVPTIMHAMLDAIGPTLKTGKKMHSVSLQAGVKEGDVATRLGALQAKYPDVSMGSYPSFQESTGFTTALVLRSRDEARLAAAEAEVGAMLEAIKEQLAARRG